MNSFILCVLLMIDWLFGVTLVLSDLVTETCSILFYLLVATLLLVGLFVCCVFVCFAWCFTLFGFVVIGLFGFRLV